MHGFRLLMGMLLGCASSAAPADDSPTQVWFNAGGYSHHFRKGNYREDNYGIGAEVIVAPEHSFIAGTFINSDRERSRYAGYHWRPWQWQPAGVEVRAGLVFALIDGYSNTNHGNAFPVAFPALSAEYRLFGANLIIIPISKNGAALALQLKLRAW